LVIESLSNMPKMLPLLPERHANHALIENNWNLANDLLKKRSRTIVEFETFDYSISLLDKILSSEVPDLLKLINLLFQAHINYSEHNFSNSLTLSWTVCEKLLNIIWDNMLKGIREDTSNSIKINNKRKEKLTGIDFTASIKQEFLNLSETLSQELYEKIDDVRKARNKWLHSLKSIDDTESSKALSTARALLKEVSGIELLLTISRSIHF